MWYNNDGYYIVFVEEWALVHSFLYDKAKKDGESMKREAVEEFVTRLVEPIIEGTPMELVDVEYVRERDWYLRVFIDKEGGVNIDDCERVSRAVDPLLDETDPIEQAYMLSVSSLGLDRPLKKDADFARNIGKRIEIKLFAPKNGKKEFTGELVSFDESNIVVKLENGELTLERKALALVRPELVF